MSQLESQQNVPAENPDGNRMVNLADELREQREITNSSKNSNEKLHDEAVLETATKAAQDATNKVDPGGDSEAFKQANEAAKKAWELVTQIRAVKTSKANAEMEIATAKQKNEKVYHLASRQEASKAVEKFNEANSKLPDNFKLAVIPATELNWPSIESYQK